MLDKLQETKNYLESKGIKAPDCGVVLGTGLHNLVNQVAIIATIPYSEIPNFPIATVEFHKGQLVFGTIGNKKVLIMQGRFHAYEGWSMQEIVFPIRVMKLLGIQYLLLSNAAGGINLNYKKGDLVLIDDHINLLTGNPLTGKNIDELGGRFPDMSAPYNKKLNQAILEIANKLPATIHTGVYVAVPGPNLETRAEYKYLKIIGADVVGMSTVPEVIAANHMELPCAAISVVTDECDPNNLKPIDIAEIIEVAGKADEKVAAIFKHLITTYTI
jgi:purine-nucleoside phosphorylase